MQRAIAGIAAFVLSTGSVLAQLPDDAPPRAETVVAPGVAAPRAKRFVMFQATPLPGALAATDVAPSGTLADRLLAPPVAIGAGQETTVSPWGRRFWADAEWLHWWIRNGPVTVPLVATGPLTDARPGVLGQPNTAQLFGPSLPYPALNGVRLGFGYWLDNEQRLAVEARAFFFSQSSVNQTFASGPTGSPLLTRPFFDSVTGLGTYDIAYPGTLSGAFNVSSASKLAGGELNLRDTILRTSRYTFTGIAGVRYLGLNEDLNLTQQSTTLIPGYRFTGVPAPLGSVASFQDAFHTRNQFYGGQLGARAEGRFGRLILGVEGKLAVGATNQTLQSYGTSALVEPNGTQLSYPGGVLAQSTNMGQFNRSQFSLVPTVGADMAIQLKSWLQLRLGYNLLYWTNVMRPGAQIDPTLNTNQVPGAFQFGTMPGGAARPAEVPHSETFWAQGFSVGLRFTY